MGIESLPQPSEKSPNDAGLVTVEPMVITGLQKGMAPTSQDPLEHALLATEVPSSIEPPTESTHRGVRLPKAIVALACVTVFTFEQRGGSLNNIKQNLIQQKKANAKKAMPPEQKKLRRRKRKK